MLDRFSPAQVSPGNHPPSEVLGEYAAGALAAPHAVVVSAHLENCKHCRQRVQTFNELGGQSLADIAAQPVSERLKDKVFARLGELDAGEDSSADAVAMHTQESALEESQDAIPGSLQQFGIRDFSSVAWKRVTKDIESYTLFCERGRRAVLLRIRPGGGLHKHTHTGDEATLILKGSFSDEDGNYCAGDYMLLDASHQHNPVAGTESECICLAMEEGPVQFVSGWKRLLNPLLRWFYMREARYA